MKKLLALLMALALLLPTIALAAEGDVVNLGFAFITLKDGELADVGEKSEGQVLATILPNHDPENPKLFPDTFAVSWMSAVMTEDDIGDPEAFLSQVVDGVVADLNNQGVLTGNPQYLAAQLLEGNTLLLVYAVDLDYSALGADLTMTMYQTQMYLPVEGDGTYIVITTADSLEGIDALNDMLLRLEYS